MAILLFLQPRTRRVASLKHRNGGLFIRNCRTRIMASSLVIGALIVLSLANGSAFATSDNDAPYIFGGSLSLRCLTRKDISGGVVSKPTEAADHLSFECRSLYGDNAGFLSCTGRYVLEASAADPELRSALLAYKFGQSIDDADYIGVRIAKNGNVTVALSKDESMTDVVNAILDHEGPQVQVDPAIGFGPTFSMSTTDMASITCKVSIQPFYILRPRDCKYSAWSQYSECTQPCGNGTQTRTRTVELPALATGTPCDDDLLIEVEPCNTQRCPNVFSAGNGGAITVGAVDSSSISINWTASFNSDIDLPLDKTQIVYSVFLSNNGNNISTPTKARSAGTVATVLTGVTAYTITGLTSVATYTINVIAKAPGANGNESEAAYVPVDATLPTCAIQVTPVDPLARIFLAPSAAIDEKSAGTVGTVVGSLFAIDGDDANVPSTYTILSSIPDGAFTLDGTTLKTAAALNFADHATSLRVRLRTNSTNGNASREDTFSPYIRRDCSEVAPVPERTRVSNDMPISVYEAQCTKFNLAFDRNIAADETLSWKWATSSETIVGCETYSDASCTTPVSSFVGPGAGPTVYIRCSAYLSALALLGLAPRLQFSQTGEAALNADSPYAPSPWVYFVPGVLSFSPAVNVTKNRCSAVMQVSSSRTYKGFIPGIILTPSRNECELYSDNACSTPILGPAILRPSGAVYLLQNGAYPFYIRCQSVPVAPLYIRATVGGEHTCSDPMVVAPNSELVASRFTLAESDGRPGATNTLSVSLDPSDDLVAGATVTIQNLVGTGTMDSASLALGSTDAALFGGSGVWSQSAGMLALTVATSKIVPKGTLSVFTFQVTNPAATKSSVRPEVSLGGNLWVPCASPVLGADDGFTVASADTPTDIDFTDSSRLSIVLRPRATLLPGTLVIIDGLLDSSLEDATMVPLLDHPSGPSFGRIFFGMNALSWTKSTGTLVLELLPLLPLGPTTVLAFSIAMAPVAAPKAAATPSIHINLRAAFNVTGVSFAVPSQFVRIISVTESTNVGFAQSTLTLTCGIGLPISSGSFVDIIGLVGTGTGDGSLLLQGPDANLFGDVGVWTKAGGVLTLVFIEEVNTTFSISFKLNLPQPFVSPLRPRARLDGVNNPVVLSDKTMLGTFGGAFLLGTYETSRVPSAPNTFTLVIRFTSNMKAGTELKIALTPDEEVLLLTPDNPALPLKGVSAAVFGGAGVWKQSTGELTLTVAPGFVTQSTTPSLISFEITNRETAGAPLINGVAQLAGDTPTLLNTIVNSTEAGFASLSADETGAFEEFTISESSSTPSLPSTITVSFRPPSDITAGTAIKIGKLMNVATPNTPSLQIGGSGAEIFGSVAAWASGTLTLTVAAGKVVPSASTTTITFTLTYSDGSVPPLMKYKIGVNDEKGGAGGPINLGDGGFATRTVSESMSADLTTRILKFTLRPRRDLYATETITIAGLVGTLTEDNESLPVWGASGAAVLWKGAWTKATGTLFLTIGPGKYLSNAATGVDTEFYVQLSTPFDIAVVKPTISHNGMGAEALDDTFRSIATITRAVITESTILGGATNDITVGIRPSLPVAAGNTIVVTGLTSSKTASNAAFVVRGLHATAFGSTAAWIGTGTLTLTVAPGRTLPSTSSTYVTFTLTNGEGSRAPVQISTKVNSNAATNTDKRILSYSAGFSVTEARESTTVPSALNTITFKMRPTETLKAGRVMTISNLNGLLKPVNQTAVVAIGGSAANIFGGTGLFSEAGSTLTLTVAAGQALLDCTTTVLTVSLRNGASPRSASQPRFQIANSTVLTTSTTPGILAFNGGFSALTVTESTRGANSSNTLTFTLVARASIAAGKKIFIEGLTGTATADGTLSITSTSSLLLATGVFLRTSGRLSLTVGSTAVGAGAPGLTVSVTVINGAVQQVSPVIAVRIGDDSAAETFSGSVLTFAP